MNRSEYSGFRNLRFDAGLNTFDGFFSLLLDEPERVKSSGKKVIAGAPLSPAEPVIASGAIAYDPVTCETLFNAVLHEKTDTITDAVEAGLSPDFGARNLISAGAVVSGKNRVPINAYTTVCGPSSDQIKKCWQAMATATESPLYFWEVPRHIPEFDGWAVDFIVKELKQLLAWLERQTGQKTTPETITEAIRTGNRLREDIVEIIRMQQAFRVPMPSLEFYFVLATAGTYLHNGEALHRRYRALLAELQNRINSATSVSNGALQKKLRIYWLGDETNEYQIFNILDDCNAVLVGCDSRFSFYYDLVKEDGNPLENLARWIWHMPVNLATAERIKAIIPRIKEQKTDAVIVHRESGSRSFSLDERLVKEVINNETSLPVLSIETSPVRQNLEIIKEQVNTFVETLSR